MVPQSRNERSAARIEHGMGRFAAFLLLALVAAPAGSQKLSDFAAPRPLPPGATLVIGFLGGWERWDDARRGVRRTVLHLREGPGLYAESVENHKRRRALDLIRDAFDTDGNGRLDAREASAARVILFGQSLGGAAVVHTARDLEKMGVPVLLTVQVDSVGRADALIPANVAAAVNFFQHEAWPLAGQAAIRAADPGRTRILGNFEYRYKGRQFVFPGEPWRVLGGSHAKMEQDAGLWAVVARHIRQAASPGPVSALR
jgi:hypothetical protein